ncbi:MAG: penicillin-binding protein 2 [Propionibacteriaceae bacterium]|jgi:peptidoglycan glycosyltransferase|nr:penicillin-binding protein 2 [Propionibacteriaceae bacterium]
MNTMNGPIRKISVLAMVMFAALLINVSVSYVLRYDSLNENTLNRRVMDARYAQQRGPIMVGNNPIASSEKVKDRFKYLRSYSDGPLYAPITGFYSYYYGASALEDTQSAELAGQADSQFIDQLVDKLAGSEPPGGTVETTITGKAQRAAWKALAGRTGAVVALDAATGAVKALVTSPSYDPNELATHDLDASKAAWERLNADPAKPMANRATREIYPTGSAFKLITAAAALEQGLVDGPEGLVDATAYQLPLSSKVMEGKCGGDEITLAKALVVSCNPAFARLGAELGESGLQRQVEAFGFDQAPLKDIPSTASRLYSKAAHPDGIDLAQAAMTGIGEFEVGATPLQMAMIGAAILNDGVVMRPYVVDTITTADLKPVFRAVPEQLSQAVSSDTALALREMMVDVVVNGTGYRAAMNGVEVGGKTGTYAPESSPKRYAWFVAFATELNVAVCAFVEDADLENTEIGGARAAAPIAKAVMEALR